MSTPHSPLGPNLRRCRLRSHFTQREAADKLDITSRTLQRWEAGDATPSYGHMRRLARLYGMTVPDFYAPVKAKRGRAA